MVSSWAHVNEDLLIFIQFIYVLNKNKNLRVTIFHPALVRNRSGLKIVFIQKKEIIFLLHGRKKIRILYMKQFLGCFVCHKGYVSVLYAWYQPVTEFKLIKLCLNDKKICWQCFDIFHFNLVDSTAEIMPKLS